MNNQSKLTSYYKKKGGKLILNMDSAKKKRLSLNRNSLLLEDVKNGSTGNIIDLCSDNEDTMFSEEEDQKSDTTILYNIDTTRVLPVTPKKRPRTPSKTLNNRTPTPNSKNKFYSPTKNRRIISPSKAKKSFNKCLFSKNNDDVFDTSFLEHCAGFDDKTIFLLKIIYKYLKDDSLKCLLPDYTSTLLSKCLEVMKPGMCLVCRLFWRQRGWYKMDELKKIVEKTIKMADLNLNNILHSLVEIGCLESSERGSLTFDEYIDILKIEELKAISKEFKMKGQNKSEILKAFKNFSSPANNISRYFIGPKSNNGNRLLQRLREKAGCCYRLKEEADLIFTKLHYLMYLGMDYAMISENKLELLLINDKANIETYPIGNDMPLDNASIIFKNSVQFERYFNACLLLKNWEVAQSFEKLDILDTVYGMYKAISDDEMVCYKALPPWLRRFTPAYIYIRILEAGIQDLKRKKKDGFSKAVDILDQLLSQHAFRQHKRVEWYLEKALILHNHMNCQNDAARLLLEAFECDLPDLSKQAMRPRAFKLATMKSNGIASDLREQLLKHAAKYAIRESEFDAHHIHQMPMERHNNWGKIKFEIRSAGGERTILDAEQFCIRHYINKGEFTHGEHWEGKMVTTIFFLLFWDIIYMRLPGVRGIFLTKYYMYPQDMFTDSFYVNRKTLIDERLASISASQDDQFLILMKDIWDSRPECERSGIDWSVGWQKIEQVCQCLGGGGVAALCGRLARNYHYAHSGFPDLTLWNTVTKQIMFVEVKTDSDTPSIKQLQWLRYLRDNGLRGQMCYVGADTTRQRARGSHIDNFDD